MMRFKKKKKRKKKEKKERKQQSKKKNKKKKKRKQQKKKKVANLACSISNNEEGVKLVRMAATQIDSLCPQECDVKELGSVSVLGLGYFRGASRTRIRFNYRLFNK
ncbi:hypothetical protein QTP86_008226 [Hemibagrus guttatus]|nr:hypothetical protein QTP86_008226 [Hemibagrus guttatus]